MPNTTIQNQVEEEQVRPALRTLVKSAEEFCQRHRRNPRLTAEQAAVLTAFETFRHEFENEILTLLTLPL